MSTQEQPVQPGDVTLEDIKVEAPAEETPVEQPEGEGDDPAESFQQFLQMFGMVEPEPVNLRKAQPFLDVEFRAYVPGDIEPFAGFESFLGSEFEAKINEAVERNLNLVFTFRCPNNLKGGDCDVQWHEYAAVINGEEFIHWFLLAKMISANGIWLDERKVGEDGTVSASGPDTPAGEPAGEPAAA